MDKSKNIFILAILLFLSIIFSYIILEDTLGSSKNDFDFHEILDIGTNIHLDYLEVNKICDSY